MKLRFPPVCILLVFMTLGVNFVFAQSGAEPRTPAPAAAQTSRASPPDALQSYRTGRDLEAMGRTADAQSYYNETVRICSEEISGNRGTRDSYTVLTWALVRQAIMRAGQQRRQTCTEAISWGDRGLRIYPDDYRLMEAMGEAYFYLDNYESSLRYMQRYVNALPQGERAATAYFFIGEIFRFQQRFLRADIAYTTAVRLEPGLALWWYRLGSVREAAGDRDPAREAYERALRINPNYREAREGVDRVRRQTAG